ncbi:recombinase family protein [Clostridium tyrobutyricum]|uniref:recombinase family protein n=1 Tax=Clostridium tyrobutyricum TaxID=1519 RepID=UPI001C39334F|nr:recombinase family protein [Clostridium tyrobutyricum]MBV4420398.1 recombinase family protein [Clostridium tyrobutyricum]
MARKTIKKLETDLKNMEFLYKQELEENERLKNLVEGKNVISIDEYNLLLEDYNNMKDMRDNYKRLYDDLRIRYDELRKNSTVINNKTVKNERGAGRKAFDNLNAIKRIYELYIQGNSLKEISDILNGSGIKTKLGGNWSKSSVRFILLNRKNVENEFINEDIYNRIVKLLNDRKKK